MNNRVKLLISVLFIALIVLCICLTRFYLDVSKNTGTPENNTEIAQIVKTYGEYRVFESTNGYYGILNSEDAVVIEPKWMEILDVTDDLVLVSQRLNNTVLIGGIDFEENVVLPFVFRSMAALDNRYYAGVVDADESRLIYNSSFEPVFSGSYDAVSYESGMLDLETEGCIFSYYIPDAKPVLRKAEMVCQIGGLPLKWRIGNQVFLSELSEEDLLRINNCIAAYMDMLIRSDFTELPQISGGDYIGGLERPNSLSEDMQFDEIGGFSFRSTSQGSGSYDFSFAISYHTDGEDDNVSQTVQLLLRFRRNADNKMILTSAALDYQSTPVQEAPADAE